MNKNIIIGIVVVSLIAGAIYWFMQSQNSASNLPSYGTTNLPSPAPAAAPTPTVAPMPSPTPVPAPASETHNITIQSFAFNPASITVKKGDTVVWTNKDSMGHTVTGDNGGPSSPAIGTNGTYRYTFSGAGTFGYHCAIHPSMTGAVVVSR